MNTTPRTTAPRRTFLKLAGAGIPAAAGIGALSGCGNREDLKASGAGSVTLPTYKASSSLDPDKPGDEHGLPAAYFDYPENPVRSVPKPPLDGETYSAVTNIFGAPPHGRAKNKAWQEIEKRLGGKVDITSVSADDFTTKFNTVVAGDDIPDLMLDDGSAISDIIGFLEAKCQDLTPFLSGDAVSEYPNLAAIPEIFWKQTVRAGKIYEIPIPRAMTAGSGFYNGDMYSDAGVDDTSKIASADDYLELMKDISNPSAKRWAFGSTGFGLTVFNQLFGVPYGWREDGGKLTNAIETDEYLDSVSFAQKANKAGCMVPGSEAWTKSQLVNAFQSGQVAQIYDGMPAFFGPTGYGLTMKSARPFIPFAAAGGKPTTYLDNIVFARTMLKKNDDAEIKKVLGIANLLAAPFGTEEYLLITYGVEGTDYTLDKSGNPISKDSALLNTSVPWKYIAAPQQVIYNPASKEVVEATYEAYSTLIPMGIENPCGTLFSPTEAKKGSQLSQKVSDAAVDLVAGRGTLDALKSAIKGWRSGGGDKIREEYESALGE